MGTKLKRAMMMGILTAFGVADEKIKAWDDVKMDVAMRRRIGNHGVPENATPEQKAAIDSIIAASTAATEVPRKFRLAGVNKDPDRVEMYTQTEIDMLNKAREKRKDDRRWVPDDTDAKVTGGRNAPKAEKPAKAETPATTETTTTSGEVTKPAKAVTKTEKGEKPAKAGKGAKAGKPAKAADPDRVPLSEAMGETKAKGKKAKNGKGNGKGNGNGKPAKADAANAKASKGDKPTGKAAKGTKAGKTATEAGGGKPAKDATAKKSVGSAGKAAGIFKAMFPKGGSPVKKVDIVPKLVAQGIKESSAHSYMTWAKRPVADTRKNPFGFRLIEEANSKGEKTLRRK